MKIRVEIYNSFSEQGCMYDPFGEQVCTYVMNHNDPAERRVLGEQIRNAFEAGQTVLTYPEPNNG